MKNSDIQKSKPFIISEEVDYAPQAIISKTIVKKVTGSISVFAFDAGEKMAGVLSPFDNFVQAIEGSAEIIIDDKSTHLAIGQSIIVPAHSSNTIKGTTRFKMISTVIKSGYEDVT